MLSLAVHHHLYPANLLILSIVREELPQAPSRREASMTASLEKLELSRDPGITLHSVHPEEWK